MNLWVWAYAGERVPSASDGWEETPKTYRRRRGDGRWETRLRDDDGAWKGWWSSWATTRDRLIDAAVQEQARTIRSAQIAIDRADEEITRLHTLLDTDDV